MPIIKEVLRAIPKGVSLIMKQKKRVAAIITEYRFNSHADRIIGKMLDGIYLDGREYTSTLEIASGYVDQFPENDMSREKSKEHGFPIYDTIEAALKCGGSKLAVDGILIIGEHGDYPLNEYDQKLYPRRRLFEECYNVMMESDTIVPVFTDKHFAVELDDVTWVWSKVTEHNIPFMAGSSVPFTPHSPVPLRLPQGAPISKMMAVYHGPPEAYGFHALEMLQSVAETRAYGESGVSKVRAIEGKAAADRVLSEEWYQLYNACCGAVNPEEPRKMPYRVKRPVFYEVEYRDGLVAGLFNATGEMNEMVSAYQTYPGDEPFAAQFVLQGRRPHRHFDVFVLEIERFIHTSRPPFPKERTYLTSGILDACMRSLHTKEEVATPHLEVRY